MSCAEALPARSITVPAGSASLAVASAARSCSTVNSGSDIASMLDAAERAPFLVKCGMTASLIFADKLYRADAIDARARQLGGGLAGLGIEDGDVIAVMLRNDPVFVDLIRACRIAGCYYCPINWHFKSEETGYILRDSGAKAFFVHADLLPMIADAIPRGLPVLAVRMENDVAVADRHVIDYDDWLATQTQYSGSPREPRGHMAYTSGTTGRPKGIRRFVVPPEQRETQQAVVREVIAAAFGITSGVRMLLPAPLYHSGPSLFAQQAMEQGDLLVLAERFDAEQTLALIEQHRIETVYLVPIMYVRLLRLPPAVRDRYDLSSVRFVASTGSPCAPSVKQAMLDWWGPVIYETYASSEAGLLTVLDPASARLKPGSAGKPLASAEIRILRPDGAACATGEAGEIYGRHPAYADFTYQNNPQARLAIGRDGLVTVGDVGYVDADGYLYICDRASDMVISGGVNIYPAEIEQVLMTHAGVTDCAVFGIPDEEYGESLVAMVCATEGVHLAPGDVRSHLRQRLADYKVPRRIEIVAELPRDDNGKLAKRKLRDQYWSQRGRRI